MKDVARLRVKMLETSKKENFSFFGKGKIEEVWYSGRTNSLTATQNVRMLYVSVQRTFIILRHFIIGQLLCCLYIIFCIYNNFEKIVTYKDLLIHFNIYMCSK